jgi:hypothetical protein
LKNVLILFIWKYVDVERYIHFYLALNWWCHLSR